MDFDETSSTMGAETEEKLRRSVRGVAQTERTDRGLRFSRLPAWTYLQHAHAPIVAQVAERLSGARFELETSADRITLRYRSLRDAAPSFNWICGPSTISLTAQGVASSISHSNGDVRVWEGEKLVEIQRGEDSIAAFQLPVSDQPRMLRLWLPQNCAVEIIDVWANAEWQPVITSSEPMWVHYGSSISHCEDAATPIEVWSVAAANALGLGIHNLGLAGAANLEQFAARTIRDLPADVISLKVGINIVNGANHTARTFVPAVHGFIDTIREGHPHTPILVISPICCPGHEKHPGPSETNAEGKVVGQPFSRHEWIGELTLEGIRDLLRDIVRSRSAADANIHYMDGLDLFDAQEALTMPDGIHPDAAGYRVIAANFLARFPRQWLASLPRG